MNTVCTSQFRQLRPAERELEVIAEFDLVLTSSASALSMRAP